jgi:hypothetical protein
VGGHADGARELKPRRLDQMSSKAKPAMTSGHRQRREHAQPRRRARDQLLDPRLVRAGLVLGRRLDFLDHLHVFVGQRDGAGLDTHVTKRREDANQILVILVFVHAMDDNARPGGRPRGTAA